MREIKFRAWDKRTKQMFDHDDFLKEGRLMVRMAVQLAQGEPDVENAKGGIMLHTDDENMEFMQFTGLKDMYFSEIYDSFIVKQFDDICLIERCIGGFQCNMIGGPHKGSTFVFSFLNSDYCEIIGNKWENPELLEANQCS